MKFCYQYRTRDNAPHEGVVEASDREAAFAALKAQGIKPARLWEAPGLANKVLGRGKRWIAIAVLAIVATAFAALVMLMRREVSTLNSELETIAAESLSAPRHQIYGDPAIMEPIERGSFEALFRRGDATNRPSALVGEEVLAWFAQPGRIMAGKTGFQRRCTPEIESALATMVAADPVSDNLEISPDAPREIKELKQIVNGMKQEMRAYLANGNGTVRSFYRRLIERTQREMQIYERTQKELEKETDPVTWEQKNAALRKLGLRTIPMPGEGS